MATDDPSPAEIAQTEHIGLGDLALALLLGALTFVGLTLWAFPGLYPGVWESCSVAAGARPSAGVLPGYAVAITDLLFRLCGITSGEAGLRILGRVLLALSIAILYLTLREMLVLVMRMRPQHSRRRTFVMRFASVLATCLFAAADPVWSAGQCFGAPILLLFLTLFATYFYFLFLRKGRLAFAYLCTLILGFLAAETTVGIVLPMLFIALALFMAKVMPVLESPLFRPATLEVGKWHMTFLYLAGLVTGVAINAITFVTHHGLGAIGERLSALPFRYLIDYWASLTGAAEPLGWVLWLALCLCPAVVAIIRFPAAADEERFLNYATGVVFFFCGAAAFSQSSILSALWFWTYTPFGSRYLLTLGLALSAVTFAFALTILGVDALCRDHRRLAELLFGNDEEGPAPSVSRSTNALRRISTVVIAVFALVMTVPSRRQVATRAALGILKDGISATVTEAGDATWLFTDGRLDAALELESVRRGGSLKCLSLLGDAAPRATFLRTRAMPDDEDLFSFRYDTGMGLRSWIRDKPERLASCGVQMGFDLWKRDAKPLPPMGGLLSRPGGFASEAVRTNGVSVAHALAQRVLNLYATRGGVRMFSDPTVRDALDAFQWRLARMCVYRSEADDLAGRAEAAISEMQLSKRLDEANRVYRHMLTVMEKRNALLMQKLTPREGLQLALVRADFDLGRVYAETILGADPENPDANFAMGMYYAKERQFSRAEAFLRRCLIRRPEEPAVYNNLAMVEMDLGKFDAAEANVAKALKLVPDSASVLDTKRKIAEARAKAAARAQKPPAKQSSAK